MVKKLKKHSIRRKILFSATAVFIVLCIATIILEITENKGLIGTETREDSLGNPPVGLMSKEKIDGIDYWSFGSANMVKGRIKVEKNKNTFRIVCSGGSFLMGFPYTQSTMENPGYAGIPHWLYLYLKTNYPGKNVEVINMAAVAQNSTRVKWVVKKAVKMNPDLVFIATGNNEGNIAFSTFSQKLHRWIIFRGLKKAVKGIKINSELPVHVPQPDNVNSLEKVFSENIDQITWFCKDSEIPLIIATIPINYRYHYFEKTAHQGGIGEPENDIELKLGKECLKDKKFEKAIDLFSKSKSQTYSLYYLAKTYDLMGDKRKAKEFYTAFVQLNPLTRTRPTLNEIIRKKSKTGKFFLIDLQTILENKSIGKIPNETLFNDYCHMKWWANQMFAKTIFDFIERSGIVKGNSLDNRESLKFDFIIEKNGLESLYDLNESHDRLKFLEAWESETIKLPDQDI